MLSEDEYKARFAGPASARSKDELKESETRAGRALASALDIRKFEIDLYWKRATYFWAFIAAAFAGYALTYKTAVNQEPWLSIVFSSLGVVFSFAWHLVNRGSKFWQKNWERHVDMLEDMTLGPLYKVISVEEESIKGNPLNSPGQFSVSKINQVLSAFVTTVWLILFAKSLLPVSLEVTPDLVIIVAMLLVTSAFLWLIWSRGRSSHQYEVAGLHERGKTMKLTSAIQSSSSVGGETVMRRGLSGVISALVNRQLGLAVLNAAIGAGIALGITHLYYIKAGQDLAKETARLREIAKTSAKGIQNLQNGNATFSFREDENGDLTILDVAIKLDGVAVSSAAATATVAPPTKAEQQR